jgi:hypothetical protein
MPKATDDQKALISRLLDQGHTHQYIADQLGWTNKTAVRSVARVAKELREGGGLSLVGVSEEETMLIANKTLDEMTREQRVIYLKKQINETPRCKFVFEAFSPQEQAVFIDEYVNIVAAVDSLTEPEEQGLFAAIGEFVLAYRALRFKTQEERWYEDSMNGLIEAENADGDRDPRFRRTNDSDKYRKGYDDHMKLYQRGISELKMSRVQRMKEVRSDRKSLVDVIEAFSHKNAQADASEAIIQLQGMRDEQLKEMLENGFIYGVFED